MKRPATDHVMRLIIVVTTLALALGVCPPAAAQARPSLGAGIGLGSDGFAGVAAFDVAIRDHLITLRAAGMAAILGDDLWDVGVLYGRSARWRRGVASASLGVAIMDGVRCNGLGPCTPLRARASVPAAARVRWHILPALGVGVHGFVNVNGEQSFGGVALTVEVGRL